MILLMLLIMAVLPMLIDDVVFKNNKSLESWLLCEKHYQTQNVNG